MSTCPWRQQHVEADHRGRGRRLSQDVPQLDGLHSKDTELTKKGMTVNSITSTYQAWRCDQKRIPSN